jgi:catechol 2,3-dioxygenase-like lactoylglutathione lyase family enzyme
MKATPMRIHHLALRTPDPSTLAAFYVEKLGVPLLRTQEDHLGVRSCWLGLDDALLMIERGAPPSPEQPAASWDGVFLAVEPGAGAMWAARLGSAVFERTAYTLYARDPDGNRFGVSSYPAPLFAG